MKDRIKKYNRGITLIVLIITIIVLLILAGITISAIIGDNGILLSAINSKEKTEISEEKEIVEKAATQAIGKNKYGNLQREDLKQQLELDAKDRTNLYEDEEKFIIEFKESKRVYGVDKDGNITQEDRNILSQDSTPGKMDGTGRQDNPYIIMSIEDLVEFSKEASEGSLTGVYVRLGRNLNFNSELSYCNTDTREYNDFLGVTDDIGIKEALTNTKYSGFKPITNFRNGTFLGNNHVIKNIYEHVTENSGLFSNSVTEIRDLELTGEIICDGDNAGGIMSGTSSLKIENCISRVNIKANGTRAAGIVAGVYSNEINNCVNYGNIESKVNVSGISSGGGSVKNCINYGNIKGIDHVAGINAQYSGIVSCTNYGKVEGDSSVAGIIAQTTNNPINKAYNYGYIKGISNVGGIIANGAANTSYVNLVNYGDVEGSSTIGGIVGYTDSLGMIGNCVNLGKIKGDKYIAGICGQLNFTQAKQNELFNCYTIGNVEGTTYVGAIAGAKIGYGTHYVKKCYWKKELNLECCAYVHTGWGELEIENSNSYEDSFIKTQEFVNLLNENVKTYNEENSSNANFIELSEWKFTDKSKYPITE